jgi:hypothetical protein
MSQSEILHRLTRPKVIEAVGTKTVPAHSGGIVLSSGEVVSVTVKALAKNSGDIYVGGADVPPYSGAGFCLEPGEAWNIDVGNLNEVRIVATVSGDRITYGGIK